MRTCLSLLAVFAFAFPLLAQERIDLSAYTEASTKKWASAMKDFKALNVSEKNPENSILFVGSSSIRLWKTIATDLKPYHAIQRGFGGSRWSDVAVHADELITPHRFKAVVFFVANDISGKANDRTPAEVLELVIYVSSRVHAHNPKAEILCIATTPTESRWGAWPEIRKANELIRDHCRKTPLFQFIGTESLYLNEAGTPRSEEFFVSDKLHLNPAGYALWTSAVKSQLDSVLGGAPVLP